MSGGVVDASTSEATELELIHSSAIAGPCDQRKTGFLENRYRELPSAVVELKVHCEKPVEGFVGRLKSVCHVSEYIASI